MYIYSDIIYTVLSLRGAFRRGARPERRCPRRWRICSGKEMTYM